MACYFVFKCNKTILKHNLYKMIYINLQTSRIIEMYDVDFEINEPSTPTEFLLPISIVRCGLYKPSFHARLIDERC